MRQSEQVVLRDTSAGRQALIKEKEDWAPIVTRPLLHGYIVAPPGPITHIHIQEAQQQRATPGTDAKAAKPERRPGFCRVSIALPASQHQTAGLMTGRPSACYCMHYRPPCGHSFTLVMLC